MLMLVTRPEPDAQASIERLSALGIDGVAAPLMTRQNLDATLPPPNGFAAMAVSSTNALRALEENKQIEPYLGLPIFVVGDRTAHEATQLGFTNVTSAEGTLETMAQAIGMARLDGPVLYPAGRHLSGDLAHKLAPHGLMTVTVPVYEMVAESAFPAAALAQLSRGEIGAVLVYSRRTAEIFSHLVHDTLPVEQRRELPMLCMSENVAEPLLGNHFSRILLADYPSEEAMMALALAFAREQSGS